jgi:hypothetical protein
MKKEMAFLLKKMSDPILQKADVISWGAPIPSFGKLTTAKVATVGLNPSNREFVDVKGHELEGTNRRFHTLKSLGLDTWDSIEQKHLDLIIEVCFEYFNRNPYDAWFKKLDNLISGSGKSYYFPSHSACHLDLIPFATFKKWTELDSTKKSELLDVSSDFLGMLLNNSDVETMVLNGQTVVDSLQKMSKVELSKTYMEDWTLPRANSGGVSGYAYKGQINDIGNVKLNRPIRVLGYNHNIQSSFGVTKNVQISIRNWFSTELTLIK